MIHPVIIAGAGPVGMIAAMDLAYRGVSSIILEKRSGDMPAEARCNTTSARTMETLRRLGCDKAYRQCGLATGYTNDMTWSTSITGKELARCYLPSGDTTAGQERLAFDSRWPSSERPHRASQFYLERVLRKHLETYDNIDIRFCQEVVGISQQQDEVDVQVKNTKTGEITKLSTSYLIGCDGGRSSIRKLCDIKLAGDTFATQVQTVLFRSKDVLEKMKQCNGPGWMNVTVSSGGANTIIAINGEDLWLMHGAMKEGRESITGQSIAEQIRTVMGCEINYQVEATYIWKPNRLVAQTYRDGNVFIAGDAAHVWPPMAGHGMNSGVEDAIGLSWLIAACVNGWADTGILDAYDAERQPSGERISKLALGMLMQRGEVFSSVGDLTILDQDSEDGIKARKKLKGQLQITDAAQFNPQGMNFGLNYASSPIVIYDDGVAPEYQLDKYTPTTVPGCRAPFFALIEDGSSIYDHFSQGYSLLRSDVSIDVSAFEEAAKACGMPFTVIDIQFEPAAQELYHRALVLVRADDRIAWRGDSMPENASRIIDTIRGVK